MQKVLGIFIYVYVKIISSTFAETVKFLPIGDGVCNKYEISNETYFYYVHVYSNSQRNCSVFEATRWPGFCEPREAVREKIKLSGTVCCENYERILYSAPLKCSPVCEPKCIRGTCIAPNICSCPEDMVLLADNYTCSFVCNPPCENGDCIGHNKCKCHRNYLSDPDEPNFCLPICYRECENSDCVAPNMCKCHENYEKNPFRWNECILTLTLTGKKCEKGMILLSDNVTCSYVCEPQCENGDCIGGNICNCHKGYIHHPDTPNLCVPTCETTCINSDCVGHNFCKCHNNYKPGPKKYECIPICSQNCVNSNCTSPDTCSCFEGYTKNINKSNECIPKCDNCENGECIEPNVCQCNNGYIFNALESKCVLNCETSCVNSTCIEGCNRNTTEEHDLEPSCNPACVNGTCVAPNTCKCNNNYKISVLSNSICEPICENGCKNGYCIEPNKCSCDEGFIKNETTEICDPVCQPPCINSDCIEPNVCDCHEGYHKVATKDLLHVCKNKTKLCRKKIKNGIKKLSDSICYEFSDELKAYDNQCRIDFTNTSCFDEFCKYSNSEICNMVYTCEIRPDDINDTLVAAHCSWSGKYDSAENVHHSSNNTYNNNKIKHKNIIDLKSLIFQSSDIFESEHSFKQQFDMSTCLLCLCPAEKNRVICEGERINLMICQCTHYEDEHEVDAYDTRSAYDLIISELVTNKVALFAVSISVLSFCVILWCIILNYRRCKKLRVEHNEYIVQAYNNDVYGMTEVAINPPENFYTEIIQFD